jgi:hypothetical protein
MANKKILILKNDRGGDLLNSIKCISSILHKNNKITIYLSQFNYGFAFLFKNALVKKINYDLNLINKIYFLYLILRNNYDEVYILTPKNFYYFLPFIFRKIKFFAITVDGVKRCRPSLFLRKFLYKFVTIDRKNVNIKSSSVLQLELITNYSLLDLDCKNLNTPQLENYIKDNIPKGFIFIQYKENFFNKINLISDNYDLLLNQINKKFKYIIFFSDIEITASNNLFLKKYNFIDCEKKIVNFKIKDPNIIYLHNINSENLFSIIEKSKKVLCPHGLLTHLCKFYKKESLNIFNFAIKNKADVIHQKIAFSEWYKNMNIKFLFLNKNIKKSIKKILKNI